MFTYKYILLQITGVINYSLSDKKSSTTLQRANWRNRVIWSILKLFFRDEFQEFVSSKTLSHLHVCFSRDSTDNGTPRYVQHLLANGRADISDLITQKEAVFYVCGDATRMSKDVNDAVVSLLAQNTGMKFFLLYF